MCADVVLNTTPDFTSSHTFSTNDLTGGFDGLTQADPVPSGELPLIDFSFATPKNADGTLLYPVNTEFGYIVTDFIGAVLKSRIDNPEYEEGWIGDLKGEGDVQAGVVISDAPTDTFKTPALLGTWLAGLGDNTVKASTEHYVVMQNILSDQKYPGDPDALYPLDDNLMVIGGEFDGQYVADILPTITDLNGDGAVDIKDILAPNETEITANIAVSTDYSVTLKDDGKLLYRWGNTIKKPNDMRLDIKLDLPDAFTDIDEGSGLQKLYKITAGELLTNHTITNNPNDQIRPEDLENEAAIGQLPGYVVVSDWNEDGAGAREVWVSDGDYYAGDGTFYPAGTVLRDDFLAANWAASDLAAIGSTDGAAGFTNAWYTTMDREPFEADLNDTLDGYDVGPRWRLQPDKYGQDLPSVVIPIDPSLPPPPTKDEVKYDVGTDTQTVINLLDWGAAVSRLSISAGYHNNSGTVSVNGVNMTNDLDVAFYVKGDIKPATLYDTQLFMDYEEIAINDADVAVNGTVGDDHLVGQGGNAFSGGTGNDLFVVNYGGTGAWSALNASTIADFTAGEDVISLIDLNLTDAMFLDMVEQTVVGGDLVISLKGNDLVTLTGVTETLDLKADFMLINRAVNDTLTGTAGDDFLVGDAGENLILGVDGDDTIWGMEGDDFLNGGNDADVILGNEGNDQIGGGAQADLIYAGFGDDTVWGGYGKDKIYMNDGDDVFNDIAQFNAFGNDMVFGGDGNDVFNGVGGNDTYFGGNGTDRLLGAVGDDRLTGGADADIFAFVAGAGHGNDTIADFEDGLDKIEISGVGFGDLTINDTASGAVVSWFDGSITLTGIMDANLTTDDFLFV
jgi:Ca2+-binding RTX toxin-like protein